MVQNPREVHRAFGGHIRAKTQLTPTRVPLTSCPLSFGLMHHDHHAAALELLEQQSNGVPLIPVAGGIGDQLTQLRRREGLLADPAPIGDALPPTRQTLQPGAPEPISLIQPLKQGPLTGGRQLPVERQGQPHRCVSPTGLGNRLLGCLPIALQPTQASAGEEQHRQGEPEGTTAHRWSRPQLLTILLPRWAAVL